MPLSNLMKEKSAAAQLWATTGAIDAAVDLASTDEKAEL